MDLGATCLTLMSPDDNIYIGNTQTISSYDDHNRNNSSRLISPLTQQWLTENYEVAEGASVPRNVLYEHYLDFCVRNGIQPVNAASFGKIIRQHFPNLRTRRLGSRGHSKYHYYGLTIRESSVYHRPEFTSVCKGNRSRTSIKPNIINPVRPVPADVLASLLPDFPNAQTLSLPDTVPVYIMQMFLDRYRQHAQNILEVIVKAAFSEVEPLLKQLWVSLNPEIIAALEQCPDLVAYCDLLLYKTIISLLLPTPLHPIPSSLTQTIRSFCKQFGGWIRVSVKGLSHNLAKQKLEIADIFVSMMRRQTTLTHIAQATRTVLSSSSAVNQMIHDWCHLDIDAMTHQALFLFSESPQPDSRRLKEVQMEFSELLGEQASLEEYAEWVRELVDTFVIKKSTPETFAEHSHTFLTQWSYFISRIVRDLTLRSAPSFGSFHLLHMLFTDYVLHLLEEHQHCELQTSLWSSLISDSVDTSNNTGTKELVTRCKVEPIMSQCPNESVMETRLSSTVLAPSVVPVQRDDVDIMTNGADIISETIDLYQLAELPLLSSDSRRTNVTDNLPSVMGGASPTSMCLRDCLMTSNVMSNDVLAENDDILSDNLMDEILKCVTSDMN